MTDIKIKFESFEGVDSFRRIDNSHILDIYLGIDNISRYTLFLISETEPVQIYSSQIINVFIGQRKDLNWGISFSLIDNQFIDLFCHFCSDIIDSSKSLMKKEKGAEFICNRYIKWQNMLSKYKGDLLSPNEIKGLLGEIYFLKNFLIPLYGQEKAINAWIGPEKADQDFVIGCTWYEVKSTSSGTEYIKISSIEQLDTIDEGELAIVFLDKTSYADDKKITLNSIYAEVYSLFDTDTLKQQFRDILLNFGFYPRPEYDEYKFRFSKMDRYCVNSIFPCIRKGIIPNAVKSLTYEIELAGISGYLKG